MMFVLQAGGRGILRCRMVAEAQDGCVLEKGRLEMGIAALGAEVPRRLPYVDFPHWTGLLEEIKSCRLGKRWL